MKINIPFGYLLEVAGHLSQTQELESTEKTENQKEAVNPEERKHGFLEKELEKIDAHQ